MGGVTVIIKTIRDAEMALNRLSKKLEGIESIYKNGVTKAELLELLEKQQPRIVQNVINNINNENTNNLTILEVTLTSNTTVNSPVAAVEKALLAVFVTQTASFTVSFNVDDFATDYINTNIPEGADTVTAFFFIGRKDGKWWPVTLPLVAV
jgi:hypothetical protein